MQFKCSRQVVTGLTVNEKVNITQKYWRSVRSMCHSVYQTGTYHFPVGKSAATVGVTPPPLTKLSPLIGMLGHVYHVKRGSGRFPDSERAHFVYGHADHARFWFYRLFVALEQPLVICEGVTDNVYLRNAIARLPAYQPDLGAKGPNGFRYAVSFFSYSNIVHRIMGITGGYSPLLSLNRKGDPPALPGWQ